MVDQSKQYDFSGNTLICNDVIYGVPSGLGSDGITLPPAGLTAGYPTNDTVKFTIKGVNFNSATTDNPIAITLPPGATTYSVNSVFVWGASHTLTTATAGLFSAASGAGTAICADQALTPTSGTADTNLNYQEMTRATAAANTCFTTAKILYFRIGTAESAAATGNVTLVLNLLG